MKIKLENGIILDDDNIMVETIQRELNDKLEYAKVWLADDNGDKNYLLTINNIPVHETKSAEAMYSHINMIYIKEHLNDTK